MDSETDARRLIESIREECGLNSQNGRLLEQFDTMIEMFSNQLYDTSTHFLLELLQNADDNVYNCSEPQIKFTYEPGYLRVDCNEVGFSAANVKAISAIGASTKSGHNKVNGFTGEKGIGFKSVFKVADVVWVASGPYKFNFDKRQRLGMIAPTWADFPGSLIPGHTSFYFQLSKDYDQDELLQDLRGFDPGRLLFLRRIKTIELSIQQADGRLWAAKLDRTMSSDPEKPITMIQRGSEQFSYHVMKHKVDALPVDVKRPGFSMTELQLAFPVFDHSRGMRPDENPKHVYAYLPIGDYGLKFILQGDFLLTASRLQIDASSSWNQALRDALGDAFLHAVEEFNKGNTKYHWPHYLPDERTAPFFKPAQQRIWQALTSKPVVESFDGSMRCPRELAHVPSKFIGRDGLPFSLNQQSASRYLSLRYPAWTIPALHILEVSTLSNEQFLNDLGGMIAADPVSFRSHPEDWHASLASSLVPFTSNKAYMNDLRKIPLVPLTDGSWVSADTDPVFFVGDLQLNNFPIGDAISIVDPQVAASVNRRNLFRSLGIKTVERAQLCSYICEAHSAPTFEPEKWTTGQLVAQATLMFQSAFRPPKGADLWFATSDNGRCKGSRLYFRGQYGKDSCTARVFQQLEKNFPILHPDYAACRPGDKSWHSFLTDSLHLSAIPRLVSLAKADSKPFRLSDEFRYIFRICHPSDVLGVLNEHWHTYSRWLEADGSAMLLNDIADVTVRTSSGPTLLRYTVLPGLDQRLNSDHIPILEFDRPVNELQKERLSRFGIAVFAGVQYYLSCLKSISTQFRPDIDSLSYIYEQIQERYDGNEDFVGIAFRTQNFVFVSAKGRKSDQSIGWISITECAKRNTDLATAYPQSQQLFKFLLADSKDTVERLIAKTTKIDRSHGLETIAELFAQINDALANLNQGRITHLMKQIQQSSIFPISRSIQAESYDDLQPIQAMDWLVADRPHLRASFAGQVPLLAFSPKRIHSLARLLSALKLDSRRLSRLTTSKDTPRGVLKLSESHTKYLRSRANFLTELIPESAKERSKISREVKNLSIYQASEISQIYTAKYRNSEYIGRPCNGEVALSPRNNSMQLYLTREGLSSKTLPLAAARQIADHCGVTEPLHLNLLQAVLGELDVRRLQSTFAREGFFVEVDPNVAQSDSSDLDGTPHEDEERYMSLSGDIFTIPSPFDFPKDDIDDEERFKQFGTKGKRGDKTPQRKKQRGADRPDRRIPIMNFTENDDKDSVLRQGAFFKDDELDPHRDLQYLGECMTSRLLQVSLERTYNPTSRWTSPLKARAGLQCFGKYIGSSSFTFEERDSSKAMTDFLVKNGHPDAARWKHMHPNYHLEIMVSAGDSHGVFRWGLDKLERARRFQLPDRSDNKIKDVLVLIQISNVYTEPKFHVIIDPWQLVKSKYFAFKGDHTLEATISTLAVRPLYKTTRSSLGTHWKDAGTVGNDHRTQTLPNGTWRKYEPATQNGVSPRWSTGNWRIIDDGQPQEPIRTPSQQHWRPSENTVSDRPTNTPFKSKTDAEQISRSQPELAMKWSSNSTPSTLPLANQGSKLVPPPNETPTNTTVKAPINQANRPQANGEVPAISALKFLPETATTQYQYHKLPEDHVRLFMLFPGESGAPLKGAIYSVPFDDAGIYRTLSYVWGDEDQQRHPLVTPDGSIQITNTLKTCLEKLRMRKISITLWVDALCINQAEPVEKSQQIRLLPEIFQGAACTLAFLGADGDSDAAIEMLLQVRAKDVVKGKPKAYWPEDLPVVDPSWQERRTPPPDAAIWADVRALFSRAWFRRVWIVQEVAIAPTVKVICGKWMIEWYDLFAAMEIVDQEHEASNQDLRPWGPFLTLAKHREWEARLKRWPLYLLLENYRHVDSSLKRDRFFALVGLAEDGYRDEFAPDYKAKFEEVVLRVAEGVLAQDQGMKLLYRAGLSAQSDRFPSWLPDWTISRPSSLADSLDRGVEFDACASITGSIDHRQGSDEILAHGCVVDEISEVSSSTNEPTQRKSYFLEIDTMVDSLKKRVGKGHFEEWKWKTPIAGAECPIHNGNVTGDIGLHDSYKALRQSHKRSKANLAEKSSAYVSLLDDKVRGWRFALTKEGRCAVIPHEAQADDEVCILQSGVVPFVIRRSKRVGAYRLVGECFVAGMMQGELRDSFSGLRKPIRIH